ncbi:MAG: beta-ketoacyl synthase N-terminal-like domain-containing protein, partial [Chloroflexota bacterium]
MGNQAKSNVTVVGIACRFPDAANPKQFWQNLIAGKEAAKSIPPDRWKSADFFTSNQNQTGKSVSKWGGFIDDIWDF